MSKYYNLKVKDIVKETADTITIHFKHPLFNKIKYKAGQFLTLLVPIQGQTLRRAYSLSSSPNEDTLAVTVKRVEKGLVSNHLNDVLKAGDKMDIMEPIGNFCIEPDKSQQRHFVLIGAGSGVTPLMSMLKTVLQFEPNSIISLIYGNRHWNNIIFKSKLDELQQKYANRLKIVHVLSKPDNQWNGFKGRIDDVMIVNILNLLPKYDKAKTEYFLCGPEGMMDAVAVGLKRLQVPSERIHRESFVSATVLDEDKKKENLSLAQQEVRIILDGETYQVTVQPHKSILESALDAGIDMPYSCQSGLCTACRGKCKSGKVKMDEEDGLSESELKEGYVLTCVAHPLTEDVEIEIG